MKLKNEVTVGLVVLAGIAEMWLRQPTRARTLLERAIAAQPSIAFS